MVLTGRPTPKHDILNGEDVLCKNFCRYRNDEEICTPEIDPTQCQKYEEDTKISNAKKLIVLMKNKNPLYFTNQYKTGCIHFDDENILKTLVLDSKEFKLYLRVLFFKIFEKPLKTESVTEAMKTMEGFATQGPVKELKNRIYMTEKNGQREIWFDMCNEKWQSIKVTSRGWTVVDKTPQFFKKYEHQQPLCLPTTYDTYDTYGEKSRLYPPSAPLVLDALNENNKGVGGVTLDFTSSVPSTPSVNKKTLDGIFDFVHVQEKDKLQFKTILIDYCFPNNPHPVLAIAGPKGSGKTKAFYFSRRLIDPTSVDELTLSKKIENFYQTLDHHYLCFFDNINYLSKEYSDILCRAVTGIGFEKRMLYTNAGSFIRRILRCVGLNGITVATVEEDLLDRTILIFLKAFEDNKILMEKDLKANFEEKRPYLFVELLNVLSKTLAKLDSVTPKKLFRMADYTHIGCTVAEVLGHTQDEFLDAYEEKLGEQIKEAIYNSVLGNILFSIMEDLKIWKGNATDLFTKVKSHAKLLDVSTRGKEFPKAPSILGRKLRLLVSPFKALGIEISFLDDGYRSIEIFNHNYKDTDESKTELEKLEALRNFILTERNSDGYINKASVTAKIQELELDYESAITALRNESLILEELTNPNVWRVTR